jgi:hypothetical protein
MSLQKMHFHLTSHLRGLEDWRPSLTLTRTRCLQVFGRKFLFRPWFLSCTFLMETTSFPAAEDTYDEYDATLDADALLVNWAAVPLANEPPISSASTQAQTLENAISRRSVTPGLEDDYGEDDYDDSFFVQLASLEANGTFVRLLWYISNRGLALGSLILIVKTHSLTHRSHSAQSDSTHSQCWVP